MKRVLFTFLVGFSSLVFSAPLVTLEQRAISLFSICSGYYYDQDNKLVGDLFYNVSSQLASKHGFDKEVYSFFKQKYQNTPSQGRAELCGQLLKDSILEE